MSSTNHTPNYNLPQWEASDPFKREDFNEAFSKIEDALTGKGNCEIKTGTFTGTGGHGSAHPNTLTFEKKPDLLVIIGAWIIVVFPAAYPNAGINMIIGDSNNHYTAWTTWTGNTVHWYCATSDAAQCNANGVTYHYLALCS